MLLGCDGVISTALHRGVICDNHALYTNSEIKSCNKATEYYHHIREISIETVNENRRPPRRIC